MWALVLISDPVEPVNRYIWLGGNLKLSCLSSSNLAQIHWERDDHTLKPSIRLQLLRDGLLILNASDSDAGRYRCLSVERSKADEYTTTVAEYQVSTDPNKGKGNHLLPPQPQTDGPSVTGLQVGVALLVVSLVALLAWNFYKGHLPLPWNFLKRNGEQPQQNNDHEAGNPSVTYHNAPRPAESKPLVSSAQNNSSSNNNHTGDGDALGASEENDAPAVTLPPMQYIDDESEV